MTLAKKTQAALEARRFNIRVNAVSPGFLQTKIGESVTTKDASGLVESKAWGEYEARQGRKGETEEIGDVVVLLSTPRMSLVNGHNLVIDGYVLHPDKARQPVPTNSVVVASR